jgi:hypothetical protein
MREKESEIGRERGRGRYIGWERETERRETKMLFWFKWGCRTEAPIHT